jgi:ketosteroid isomerase-like protein
VSAENVDLVRRSIDAFNARDVESLRPLYREDFVYRLIGGFADLVGQEFVGQEAAIGWMMDMVETFGVQSEIAEIQEVGDKVLAILRVEAVGAASGAETTVLSGYVYSFEDGRISAVDGYYDTAEARRAVGLEEPAED